VVVSAPARSTCWTSRRDRGSERQHARVDRDLVDARQIQRRRSNEQLQRGTRERDAERAADGR
jgi:hypothetical protein